MAAAVALGNAVPPAAAAAVTAAVTAAAAVAGPGVVKAVEEAGAKAQAVWVARAA